MKQTARNKIICAIIIIVIIAGAIVVGTKGFNFDLRNDSSQSVEIYIGKTFDINDVKNITTEVFGDNAVLLQKVEVYEDSVKIIAKEITDEQKTSLVEKMNEKYELELKAEDITISNVPHTDLKDIVKPYVLPISIATTIILVYIGIRYYKLGVVKSILKSGIVLVIAELTLFAVMAITRFPIGRYTLPLVLFIYLVTTIGITTNLERHLAEKKIEEKEE